MSQTTGSFPALTDNVRKTPKLRPLPLKKILAPPPSPKKKGK